MDDKQNSSTPDVPKFNDGKGKGRKLRHKNKNKGGKTKIVVVVLCTSSNEELKHYIFTTYSTKDKKFLKSRDTFI